MLGNVNATDLLDTSAHFEPAPRRCEVNFLAFICDFLCAKHLLRRIRNHLLGQFHDLQIVCVGPIELKLCEFRIMLERDAFIAEVASNLIDAFEISHKQALEIQLKRNTQVHILLEFVVMCHERTRRRAAIQRLQDGRLDFQEIHDRRGRYAGIL